MEVPYQLQRGQPHLRRCSYGAVRSRTSCDANVPPRVATRTEPSVHVHVATQIYMVTSQSAWACLLPYELRRGSTRLRRCSYGASRFHASCDGCFAIHMRQAAPLWIATREHLSASLFVWDGPSLYRLRHGDACLRRNPQVTDRSLQVATRIGVVGTAGYRGHGHMRTMRSAMRIADSRWETRTTAAPSAASAVMDWRMTASLSASRRLVGSSKRTRSA